MADLSPELRDKLEELDRELEVRIFLSTQSRTPFTLGSSSGDLQRMRLFLPIVPFDTI